MFYKKLFVTTIFVSQCLFFLSCKRENDTFLNSKVTEQISNHNVFESNLAFNFLPTSTTNQIVVHDYYTLSYDEKYEQAEWVAYELKASQVSHNHFERPFFIADPKVKTQSASWKNYKKSGYDKGHLCPAGDMKFSEKAFDDTFFTSNISPQNHDFNDGIWNKLEGKVRYWSEKFDGIYVVTGGVLNNNLKRIGRENVAVPDYFYKVLLDKSNGEYKMIAFLVPNEDSQKALSEFVVSVDSLEKLRELIFIQFYLMILKVGWKKNRITRIGVFKILILKFQEIPAQIYR